jgi:hypothetical protein
MTALRAATDVPIASADARVLLVIHPHAQVVPKPMIKPGASHPLTADRK